jgi:hypothetical protein
MSIGQKLKHEVLTVLSLTLYFGCWLGIFVLIKYLLLAEYQVSFSGFSIALLGALVLAKVVLVLEHVPLGAWVKTRAAWVDVLLRTFMYVFGVFVVLLIEKGLDGMDEHGGFSAALTTEWRQTDVHHILLNVICLSGALLSYNMLSVVRKHLGKGALLQMFLSPLPREGGPVEGEDK